MNISDSEKKILEMIKKDDVSFFKTNRIFPSISRELFSIIENQSINLILYMLDLYTLKSEKSTLLYEIFWCTFTYNLPIDTILKVLPFFNCFYDVDVISILNRTVDIKNCEIRHKDITKVLNIVIYLIDLEQMMDAFEYFEYLKEIKGSSDCK